MSVVKELIRVSGKIADMVALEIICLPNRIVRDRDDFAPMLFVFSTSLASSPTWMPLVFYSALTQWFCGEKETGEKT